VPAGPITRLPEELPALFWLEHLATLRRNWKPVLSAILASAAAAFLVSSLETPIYHARATLEVEGITDNLLKAQDGNPNFGADTEVMDIQTQIRIMQSETLLARAKARMGTVTDPNAMRMAEQTLVVRLAGQTRIIELFADSTNPQVAAAFVNSLAEESIDQHVDARWRGTEQAAAKLKFALEDMRAKFERSEDALQAYARESGLIVTADRSSPTDEKLREIQAELSRAQADRVSRESHWESVKPFSGLELVPMLQDPTISGANEKLNDLRRQMAELGATYTPDYPKVKRVQAQIEALNAQVLTEVAGTRDRLRMEFQQARRREDLLAADYQAQATQVSFEAARRVHYDLLKGEVDSTRTLYDAMFSRVKQATIAAALRGSNMRVLDAARPAAQPYRPRIGQAVLLGALAGVFFGFVFVFGREQSNRTVQGPGDLQLLLDIPEFGAIASSKSALYEDSCKAILASILFSAPLGKARVLVVTSANPGEGKTTISVNLARALAAVGRRVLLVDGDLRCPRLHHLMDLPITTGMADLLACPGPLAPSQVDASLHRAGLPHLAFLSAGNARTEASDLLYSPRLKELFEFSRNNFDIVLIDTPPMLQIPDARVMGQAADAVLMVVRAGKTTREAALAVRQRLAEDGTTITGGVLNDWNPATFRAATLRERH
jgi:capsular exopolysaccharide synthesis family protein